MEKRLAQKNKEYLDKCLEHQKNLAKVTDLENIIKKYETEKEKLTNDLNKSNENGVNLSRMLNESRAATVKV